MEHPSPTVLACAAQGAQAEPGAAPPCVRRTSGGLKLYLSLFGTALATLAACQMRTQQGQPLREFIQHNPFSLALFMIGLPLSLAGNLARIMPASAPESDALPAAPLAPRKRRGGVRRHRWGVGLMAAGGAALLYVAIDTRLSPLGLDGPAALILGLALLLWGAALLERRKRSWLADLALAPSRAQCPWWRRDGYWLVIFLTGWTLLQVRHLDTRPGYFNVDEGIVVNYGHAAYAPRGEEARRAAWENEFHPFLSCVPRALAADLFPGRPFLGSRLVAVGIGALSLALIFMVARGLGGRLAGWLALVLLGFNHIFLTLARFGMTNLDTVAAAGAWMLAVMGMWRARRPSLALLAGILHGMGRYLYYSALATSPVVAGFFLVQLILRPREVVRRWPLLLVYLAGVLLAASPDFLYHKAAGRGAADPAWHVNTVLLLQRGNLERIFRETGLQSVPAVLRHYAWPALGGMLLWPHKGYPADYFYKGLPLIDRSVAALGLAGLLWAVPHWRRRKLLVLVALWFLCGAALPSLLTLDAPYAPRLIIGLAAMHLVAAWAVAKLLRRVRDAWPRPAATALMGVACCWSLAVAGEQACNYYGNFIKDRTQFWYAGMPWGLVDFLKTFPADAGMVYYACGPYNQMTNSVIRMMDRGFPRQTFTLPALPPPPLPGTKRTAYVFELPAFRQHSEDFQRQHQGLKRIDLLNPFRPDLGPTFHVYWVAQTPLSAN